MLYFFARYASRFDSTPVQMAILAGLAMLVLSIVLGCLTAWLRRRGQLGEQSWPALLTGCVGAVLKVLIGLIILAAMGLHLSFNSDEFARLHGGVTQRSYDAVTTIWGRPHVQREMTARLLYYTEHYYDKDGLEIDPDRLKATTQLVSYRKERVEHTIEGNPIVEAQHRIDLWMNYRMKGGAWYPGFEVNCDFRYQMVNFSDREAHLKLVFPLPSEQGLIDRLQIKIDGENPAQPVVISDDQATFWSLMAPGRQHTVTVSYHSRGLDHLRFEPGAGRQLGKYRVRLRCKGIEKADLNYPIGCMTPTTPPYQDAGRLALDWELDNAVTRLGMGIIVPKKKQEGYYVARVLGAAPWGLVLLIAAVIVTHLARGQRLRAVPLLLLATGYYLYYLLMAHIGDYAPGLIGGMAISGGVLTALIALLQFRCNRGFCAWATVVLFVLFCTAYPGIRISPVSGLLQTILHVLLLGYTIVLIVLRPGPERSDDACEA